MLKLRRELAAIREWNQLPLVCDTRTELDAVGFRVIRMAEIIAKVKQIAEQN